MSVVSLLCLVVAEKSAAICAAIAEDTFTAKLGDVKSRERLPRKELET